MLLVGAVLALVYWLLYRRFAVATDLPHIARRIVAASLATLWIVSVMTVGAGNAFSPAPIRPIVWLGMVWFAVLFYLMLGLLVIGLILLVARLVKFRHRTTLVRWLSAILVAAAVGTVAYGVVEADNPRVVQADLEFASLPTQFDGFRIALVSDIHVGGARGAGFSRRVVDLVNAQRADLIAMPGDLLDGSVRYVAADVDPLAGLHAPRGVFVVAGNHEGYVDRPDNWLDHYEKLGLTTLRNNHRAVTVDGASIDIAGVYDFDATDPAPNLDEALAGHDPQRFVMLLAHQPLQGTAASERGVDLQLSGHTHGGQMWPLMYAVGAINGTVWGPHRIGDLQMFTTRGIGAWGPPVRVGAPPDITVVTLRRGR